jgi:RNA-directed DNA polymerase
MKRYSGLYPKIYDFANLEHAYKKARRCKRYRNEVLRYSENLEENLINLQNHLIWHTYRQGQYRTFYIYEPKKRLISALPFADRVAQHAINNILEPLIDRRFYFHSYACRKGKGMHKASETLTKWIYNLTFEGSPLYAIKGDIHHYFQSIDHDRLKSTVRRIIKDPEALGLLDLIIDSGGEDGKGIPVGNLTSQLFANLYLDRLDKYVKETLRVRHYIRYMDDFVILAPDKAYLRNVLRKIETFLALELGLQLNPKTTILNCKNGVDFCGYRHFADHKKVRKSSIRKMKRTIRGYRTGKIGEERFAKAFQSWLGHIQHADAYLLREGMLQQIEQTRAEKRPFFMQK